MSGPAAGTMASLHPEALESNRQGRLTDAQRKQWGGTAGVWTGNLRMFALFFGIVGVVLLIAPGQVSLPGPLRILAGVGCLVVAAWIVYLAFGGSGLSRDARDGRVETVEGPVTKDRLQGEGGGMQMTHYYLYVSGGRYECTPQASDMIGMGGVFRVYYLPRSHRVVNLERLADVPIPAGPIDATDVLKEMPSALGIHGHERQAETMATVAAMEHALTAPATAPATPPPAGQRDARPLSESIVGAWHGLMGSVTFGADGSASASLGGTQMAGRWSVGDDGKLHLDGMGEEMVADASVAGDALTLVLDGMSMPFQRSGAA